MNMEKIIPKERKEDLVFELVSGMDERGEIPSWVDNRFGFKSVEKLKAYIKAGEEKRKLNPDFFPTEEGITYSSSEDETSEDETSAYPEDEFSEDESFEDSTSTYPEDEPLQEKERTDAFRVNTSKPLRNQHLAAFSKKLGEMLVERGITRKARGIGSWAPNKQFTCRFGIHEVCSPLDLGEMYLEVFSFLFVDLKRRFKQKGFLLEKAKKSPYFYVSHA